MTSEYPPPVSTDKDGNDIFRWNLEGFDKGYIEELIEGFLETAGQYERKLIEIRMSPVMLKTLEIKSLPNIHFKGVPIVIADTGFDETIELVLGQLQ